MEKNLITSDALELLALLMRSCPTTPTNGGVEARRYLMTCVKAGKDLDYAEFSKHLNSWKDKYANHEHSCLIEALYDVYADIKSFSGPIVGKNEIVSFFAGERHVEKIWDDIIKENDSKLSGTYLKKQLFAHVLISAQVVTIEGGRICCSYDAGSGNVEIKNILRFSDCDECLHIGDTILAHYGFFLRKATNEEVGAILNANITSKRFMDIYKSLVDKELDFEKMLYFSRSLKIADEKYD